MRRLREHITPAILVALLAAFCADGSTRPLAEYEKATIVRDSFGVPHVYGESAPAAWFALAYAMAEDDAEQVRLNQHRGAGRLAEFGLGGVGPDVLVHLLRIPQTAQSTYEDLDDHTKAMVDAFALGVNTYLAEHGDGHPEWVQVPVEPWEIVATVTGTVRGQYQTALAKLRGAPPPSDDDAEGSNVFAVGPSRAEGGVPMLGGQPQTSFEDESGPARYEYHLVYPGVNAVGAGTLGIPGLLVGGTDHVAWAGTNNNAHNAAADVYWVPIDPDDPNRYLFEGEWLEFETETFTIKRRLSSGEVVEETHVGRYTRHGPVIEEDGANAYAARMSDFENGNRIFVPRLMLEARNMDEFVDALTLWPPRTNLVMADAHGELRYVYSVRAGHRPDVGAPPRQFWSQPVDGSTAAHDWLGIVPFEDLPQVGNTSQDALANFNDGPWSTSWGLLDPNAFPRWLVWADGDPPTAAHLRGLVTGDGAYDLERMQEVAFDLYVPVAPPLIELLRVAWDQHRESFGAVERARGDAALADLEAWDARASIDSTAMTVYTTWTLAMAQLGQEVSFSQNSPPAPENLSDADALRMANGLRIGMNQLQALAGTIALPWGETHQVVREELRAPAMGGWNRAWFGQPRITARSVFQGGLNGGLDDSVTPPVLRVTAGSSYVFVTELGPGGGFRSIHPWGNATDPESPHFFDQAALWGTGQMKDLHKHDRAAVEAEATAIADCDLDRSGHQPRCVPR